MMIKWNGRGRDLSANKLLYYYYTFMTHFKKSATTVCVSDGGTQDSICVPKDYNKCKTEKNAKKNKCVRTNNFVQTWRKKRRCRP